MGIRLTEISTPLGGVAWEYTDKKKTPAPITVVPGQTINVFVSSICGDNGKYDHVRSELKKAIEETKLANVYLFEEKGAASMPAGSHYVYALEDCDICIFLIDNADGITPGVQKEIDTVKKHGIKALYYFCDERSTEKTPFEQSIMGAQYAKSKTVHRFDDLVENGARDLIDDIVTIYRYYCKGRFNCIAEDLDTELQPINIVEVEKSILPIMPKVVIENVDKCSAYILKLVLGNSFSRDAENTCDMDDWCVQFLPVLFESKSIKQFNTSMFLDTLKELQTTNHFQIVQVRWNAIQSYFAGNMDKCVECLWEARKIAEETKQPMWIVKDILIDLRNLHWKQCTANNCYADSDAQKELTESEEDVFYPLLDRVNESLHEKYTSEMYKQKMKSPYTVTVGRSFDSYGKLLASAFTIAMYNGSLTHILTLYDKIKDFTFFLSCIYSDWRLRRDLLKFAVYTGKGKEVSGIRDSYPEVLNQMSSEDAAVIMSFCDNHAVEYERFISQLHGFGIIGYYLSDADYKRYESIILGKINAWLNDESAIVFVGESIFKSLTGIAYRMSQNVLAEICCSFIKKHYLRWYTDMFKFIRDRIDIHKMDENVARKFLAHIIGILKDEKGCDCVSREPTFLCGLRKQDRLLTQELDQVISETLPQYYYGNYKLETTENEQDFLISVKECVTRIHRDNEEQGQGGRYFVRGTRDLAIIRAILCWHTLDIDEQLIASVVNAATNTLLYSRESIHTKLDAVSLLISIVLRYPDAYEHNKNMYQRLFEQRETITSEYDPFLSSNINDVSLKIALCFLFVAMDIDVYPDILVLMPYIQDDIATTISVAQIIEAYLDVSDSIVFPPKIDTIVLQNVLQWLRSDHLDVRCIAVRILILLIRNPENENTVNRQIIHLMDSECVFIKNYIMRRIYEIPGIRDDTRAYVVSKCENDPCYVVRMVCAEQRQSDKNAITSGKVQ